MWGEDMKPWNMQNLLRKNRIEWASNELAWGGDPIIGAKLVHNSYRSGAWRGDISNDHWEVVVSRKDPSWWRMSIIHGHMHGKRMSEMLVRVL